MSQPAVTVQDIEDMLTATTKRWEYESALYCLRIVEVLTTFVIVFRITDAAKRWRAWGSDAVIKDFVRQVAFNHLMRQLNNGELEPEYLRVDTVYALMEAMVNSLTLYFSRLRVIDV
ncbi:hypothetical protein DXG03_004370 [Asterophora parasitica]|uniref:Uncharacterized protein n=1 Tax=Asterophora parasitica TaxID=117018 RepID=A0A9P7GA90_9AGAR|nr:hypothetical protein DXG03_004370 [Asterophora parasitica]